jgi:hypothetical protein
MAPLPLANRHNLICTTCGLVVEEFYGEQQWVDSQRCGVNTNGFRISGFVGQKGKNGHWINMVREEYNSRKSRFNLGVREIVQLCTKGNIPSGCMVYIKHIWQMYIDANVCHKSANRLGVFIYCIFLGCHDAGYTRTIKELCDSMDIPQSWFRKGEKIMKSIASKGRDSNNNENFFYSRFIRLVQNEKMPFWYATEMNEVFEKAKGQMAPFPNDSVTCCIFYWVVQQNNIGDVDLKKIAKSFGNKLGIFNDVKQILNNI